MNDKNSSTRIRDNRIYYMDILRIIASIAVILIHISGSKWHKTDVNSFNWTVYNFYNNISQWAVPVFVMISGALFLNREVDVKKLYSKNIVRIITAFLFWSVLYGLLAIPLFGKSVKLAVGEMIVGHYHLWFLFMIVGLYIAVPILKKITESEKLTRYFLLLSFVFSFVIPTMTDFVSVFRESIADSMDKIIGNVNFKIAVGYSGYFVLGYCLSKADFSKKHRRMLYIFGATAFIMEIVLSNMMSVFKNQPVGIFGYNFSVFVLLESVSIFLFFRYRKFKLSENAKKIVSNLSKYSFGVYLSHLIFWEFMTEKFGINVTCCNPIISIPLLTLIIAILSYALSALINRIPKINKFIV